MLLCCKSKEEKTGIGGEVQQKSDACTSDQVQQKSDTCIHCRLLSCQDIFVSRYWEGQYNIPNGAYMLSYRIVLIRKNEIQQDVFVTKLI